MGKAEERCRVDCIVICEESLIWFKGMPVVIGDEPMAAGLFLFIVVLCHFIVVLCEGVLILEKNDDIILMNYGKRVDYENSHL